MLQTDGGLVRKKEKNGEFWNVPDGHSANAGWMDLGSLWGGKEPLSSKGTPVLNSYTSHLPMSMDLVP